MLRRLMLSLSAEWSPANMAQPPKIWLDDASPVTLVGGAVSVWSDRSGNGNDFTQASTSERPVPVAGELAGRQVVRFDGTNDRLLGSAASTLAITRNVGSAWCLGVVRKRGVDSTGSSKILFRADTGAVGGTERWGMRLSNTSRANLPEMGVRRLDADTYATLAGGIQVGTTWHIALFTIDWQNRIGRIAIDGTQVALNATLTTAGSTSDTSSAQPIAICGHPTATGNFLDADVAAMLVGSGAALPSTSDLQKLEGWAAWRYGLVGLLPAGHPYKLSPPSS